MNNGENVKQRRWQQWSEALSWNQNIRRTKMAGSQSLPEGSQMKKSVGPVSGDRCFLCITGNWGRKVGKMGNRSNKKWLTGVSLLTPRKTDFFLLD